MQDGEPEQLPDVKQVPTKLSDFGGNVVVLELEPNVFAVYAHLQPGSITVKVGDTVKVGQPFAKLGNTGPSSGPHLHFGLLDKPDVFSGRSLPFVFDRFTKVGAIDFDASTGDHLVIAPASKQVRRAYPLYLGIVNFPAPDRSR